MLQKSKGSREGTLEFGKIWGRVFGFFSNTKIVGEVPLDVVMHLGVSYALMVVLLIKKVRFRIAYGIIFLLSIAKEIMDSFSLTSSIEESIKDILVSMIFPTLLLIIWKVKRKRI